MEKVEMNKDMKLSEHFSLGELTKTQYVTKDGNIPSRVAIENLRNLCENWLEDLRYSYNTLYPEISPCAALSRDDKGEEKLYCRDDKGDGVHLCLGDFTHF